LDETFKFMHEDDELGYRLYKQGFDFATNPRAIVYHRLAKKAKQVLSDEAFLNGHNSVLLYRKHPEFRAGYNLGSTFFSGSAPKRWAKQRLLAWPWLAGVWRGVALALHHCGKAAGAASLCAQQIYFLQYCRGVRAAGGTLRELRDAFDRHTPILFYHSVCDTTEPSLRYMSVNPRAFAAQMRWLKARGYEAITLDQWFDWLDCAKPLPRKPVIITFDDGFRDNLQNALPILRRHDFTATIFLVSEGIGKTSFWDKSHGVAELPMLSADEVRQMTREGVSFQSHGLTQASLPSLSPAQQEVELVGSKKQLESLLGASVNYFAYPQGEFTPECAECVKAAGYRGAFSTRAGFTNLDDDRFAIRRLAVTGRDNWLTFSLMLWRGRNVAADAWRKVSSPRGEGSE
jgi:peptidoglycan/xylan/chitin deacetylase (PgdA/CDA1 family)